VFDSGKNLLISLNFATHGWSSGFIKLGTPGNVFASQARYLILRQCKFCTEESFKTSFTGKDLVSAFAPLRSQEVVLKKN
jgi:hypothetical protein